MAKAKLTVTAYLQDFAFPVSKTVSVDIETEDYSDDPNADPNSFDLDETARDLLFEKVIAWNWKVEKE